MSSLVVRGALSVALCVWVVAGAFAPTGHAVQLRSVADGVYSGAQAARGQQTFKTQCVVCHGETLGGIVGPMLTGDVFMSAWSGRPLTDLVDKIEKTMPPGSQTPLTRPQATDLAAYILQVGKLPAGQAELTAASLPQIAFPGGRAASAPATAGGLNIEVTANLAQYMRAVTFPNANVIFNVQVKEPLIERPPPPVPFDYLQWGYNQYWGWQQVDLAAQALIETTPLLLLPRRCENGLPAPVDRADYKQFAQDLVNFGKEALRVSQTRNYDAMVSLAERLDVACANCHKVYRDVAAEGKSAGSARCR